MVKLFKNIKEAHEFYKYPGSYRHGSIYNKEIGGIVRSYSNGTKPDLFLKNEIHYVIKNELFKTRFQETIKNKIKVRIFQKSPLGCLDHGLFLPKKIVKNKVVFKKLNKNTI